MLRQGWFYQDGMELVAENPEARVFYDCVSMCFYIVEEIRWNDGSHVRITEYTEDNSTYGNLIKMKWEAIEGGTPVLFTGI